MAKEAKTQVWTIKMGDVNYAWRASEDAYKGIADSLGVKQGKDTDNNLVYGSDNKPPRVRVNCANGQSFLRFCDPNKLESVIIKGSINGKKLNGQKINSVRAVQG